MAFFAPILPTTDSPLPDFEFDNDTDGETGDSSSSWYYYFEDSGSNLHIEIPIYMIYTIGFLVGMTGNILVIFAVVKSRRLHNVTCLFLANLAVADLLTVVFLIPLQCTVHILGYWSLGDALCRLGAYLHVVSPVCSIFNMMVISLERYYVVMYPLQAKSVITMGRAKRVVAAIWCSSFVVSIPALFSKKEIIQHLEGFPEPVIVCNNGWPTDTLVKLYSVYVFLLLFFIPLLVVSFAYMKLAWHLCSTRGRNIGATNRPGFSRQGESRNRVWYRNTSGWSSGSSIIRRTEISQSNGVMIENGATEACALRSDQDLNDSPAPRRHRNTGESDKIQRVVTMLIIVVALFIISWGPFVTYGMATRFIHSVPNNTDTIIKLLLQLVAACNSCVNPIIYAFLSKNFRQSFKQVIRECCCCFGRQTRLFYQPSFAWTRSSRTSYSYAPPGSVSRSSPLSSPQKADV